MQLPKTIIIALVLAALITGACAVSVYWQQKIIAGLKANLEYQTKRADAPMYEFLMELHPESDN